MAADRQELVERLELTRDGTDVDDVAAVRGHAASVPGPGPVWVFPGQGSQWAGMGASLLDEDEAFTSVVDALEALVAAESGFSLRWALTASDVVTGIAKVQPMLFAMQVGLARSWQARGLSPSGGHL
ncbi:acyltransferase domain-containing protein [Streptomyces lavendulae]|uniref:acyltransferase domain-containing protein n=1 Tax=Streptomyces lavendulae TaxID=1914 RepID=UPI0036EB60FD